MHGESVDACPRSLQLFHFLRDGHEQVVPRVYGAINGIRGTISADARHRCVWIILVPRWGTNRNTQCIASGPYASSAGVRSQTFYNTCPLQESDILIYLTPAGVIIEIIDSCRSHTLKYLSDILDYCRSHTYWLTYLTPAGVMLGDTWLLQESCIEILDSCRSLAYCHTWLLQESCKYMCDSCRSQTYWNTWLLQESYIEILDSCRSQTHWHTWLLQES